MGPGAHLHVHLLTRGAGQGRRWGSEGGALCVLGTGSALPPGLPGRGYLRGTRGRPLGPVGWGWEQATDALAHSAAAAAG